MSNKPNPKRDAKVIKRSLAGDSARDIAADMQISQGRVSQILTRNGLSGRVKEAGLPCVQWAIRWDEGGTYMCVGGGITTRALTPEAAALAWKSELDRRRRAIIVPAIPVPAPVHVVPGPLQMPATMLQLAQRAAAAQPRLLNMGSKVRDGGVL